jgi:hypothetical protein
VPSFTTTSGSKKKFKWSIVYDRHLEALLEAQRVEDPNEKHVICEALCLLGLAEHKLFSDHTDKISSQTHQYTSTRSARRLVRERNLF